MCLDLTVLGVIICMLQYYLFNCKIIILTVDFNQHFKVGYLMFKKEKRDIDVPIVN